jgi:uncharacterized protein (TIRG00374 family)
LKRRTKFVIMTLLAVLVLVALFLQADREEMEDLLENADLTIIAVVILLYFLNIGAKVLRWYALLWSEGYHPPLGKVTLYFLIGMGVNNSTPGRVSGEPVRAYLLKTGTAYPMGHGMASIFLEKTIDTIVTLCLAVIGLVLLIGVISTEAQNTLFLSIGVVALLMGAIILLLFYPKGLRRLSAWGFGHLRDRMDVKKVDGWEEKSKGFLGTFEVGTREIASNRTAAMAATGLTVVIWLNEALRLWLIFLALGYNISAESVIVAVCLASFASLLVPLGAGSSTAIAAICILAGVDSTLSTTAGLLFVMTSIWISLPLGAAAMTISGVKAGDILGDNTDEEEGGDRGDEASEAGTGDDAEAPPLGVPDEEAVPGVPDVP